MNEVITEALAIAEAYTFARPLLIVFVAALAVIAGCGVFLQRAGRSK